MELKQLTDGFLNLFDCDVRNLGETMLRVLLGSNADKTLRAYVDMVDGDLQTDNLQKIYQYYLADRDGNKQDFTPQTIAELLARLSGDGRAVYDCCAGSGALTVRKWTQKPSAVFFCEELDAAVIPFLLFNLSVRNMSAYVLHRNVLTGKLVKCYEVIPRDLFSAVSVMDTVPEFEATSVVSNPPYNIKWDAPTPLEADARFAECIPPASNANWAFVLTALSRMKRGGRCAFVLPNGVLSQDNEKHVREYVVENGLLERVILLPDRMFESTSIATCVLVFSYGNECVQMFDCRQKAVQEERLQNGQFGGASHERRTYKKNVNVLPEDIINQVCGTCEDAPGFSRTVPIAEIKEMDYLLVCSRYIGLAAQETPHRLYADIIADINRIARERSTLKITCNETLAKQLGIYEIAQMESNAPNLNETFSLVGGKYEERRWLTLSKNKNELKIENQDKELLSSLLTMFLPMWKQHIFYLNAEENRLLAELRDAMLPKLMSGKLSV